jgi:hypothetical protein
MRQIVTAALVVVFCVTASPAGELTQQDRKSPAQSPEAARQYKALLKGYEEEEDAREFAERFLQLALKHPRDVVAIDSLSWIAVHVLRGPELGRALVRLKQQHLSSNKLAAVCEALERKSSTAAEQLLRGTLAKSPHRTVRTQACFSLARFLERKMTLSSKLAERPELKPRFEQFYGKDFTRLLVKLKPSATVRETERLYTRVVKDFADISRGKPTGDQAVRSLFRIQHLSVGRPAPEISGRDVGGKAFKLSDYRGKVVVVDFWGHW